MNWAGCRDIRMLEERLSQRVHVSHKYIQILKNCPGKTTYLWAILSSVEFVNSEEGFQRTVVCYGYSLSLRCKDKS